MWWSTIVALGTPSAAWAQDSGADLLDIARRAAVVDQVLGEQQERMRHARTFGTDQRVRAAMNTSYYLVSDLELTTAAEGTFEVQMSRTYSGFLVDFLGKRRPDGGPGEQVLYLSGGGIAYGLSRPYTLPLPAASTTGTAAPTPSRKNDLTGTQYSDEQYALGGRWRGFSAEAGWARGQLLQATDDGRADFSTLEQRLNRGQVVLDSPLGLRVSTRWAVGGTVENVAVALRLDDVVDTVRENPMRQVSPIPAVTLGFRKSDYQGDHPHAHPRILGAGVTEDFRWLFGVVTPERGTVIAKVRTQADLDLAARGLELALAEGELSWSGRGEIGASFGGSYFHDDALRDVVGRGAIAGVQGGAHVGGSVRVPRCEPEPDPRPDSVPCLPQNLGLRTRLSFAYRESWAEELRYLSEYAGKSQTWIGLELTGGG